MKEKPKLKNIYKKSIAIELIKLNHNLHHTMRNRSNEKYQIFVFEETHELIRDMLAIVEWQERLYQERNKNERTNKADLVISVSDNNDDVVYVSSVQ